MAALIVFNKMWNNNKLFHIGFVLQPVNGIYLNKETSLLT